MIALSQLRDKVITVPAPTQPLELSGTATGLLWDNSGNWRYAPAGKWRIQNAMVDYHNRIGAWSAPVDFDMPLGWILIGSNWNLPEHPSRAAVVWRATQEATRRSIWLVELQGSSYAPFSASLSPVETKAPWPWSSNTLSPYTMTLHDRGNANLPINRSPLLVDNLPPPQCWVASHNLGNAYVAWSWVTHSGETRAMETIMMFQDGSSHVGYRRFDIVGQPPPLGALGRYIYREIGGQVRRQKVAPWLPDEPESYLFGIQDQQPILWEDTIGPIYQHPAKPAWSVVSPLQQAFFTDHAAILIDAEAYTYGPVIDPWKPGIKKRTVSAPGMAGWTLKQRSTIPPLETITTEVEL